MAITFDLDSATAVEIVVPVYNEAADLAGSIRRLQAYLTARFPVSWCITIADNASTDATWSIACALAAELDGVRAVHLSEKGRGRALRRAWSASTATVVAYMDVDLSTDLDALLPLVAPLLSGHSDLAIGTRLGPSARVVRGPKRELISRAYNVILRTTLRSGFSDAQCGFKAVRTDVARRLLPLVEDEAWFFDTELLVVAEHNGLRIHEVPVDWVDDADSRVDIAGTAAADLRGIARMAAKLAGGRPVLGPGAIRDRASSGRSDARGTRDPRLAPFVSVAIVESIGFALLVVAMLGSLGIWGATLAALALCSLATAAANRRFAFALHGRAAWSDHALRGLGLAVLPLLFTSAALLGAHAIGITATASLVLVLVLANTAATAVRVGELRRWATGAYPTGPILRFWRGRPEDPAWVRPALLALLVGTGLLYLWNLDRSHWANAFYSAAVQASTRSWKAFFFGSSDASNFITVDKPPAALWVMDASARLFGINSWSILVPQALEGVAAVGLLYATVRRWFGPFAGLLAGAVMAMTPVVVLIFRYNNPDALLVLLMIGAAYAMARAHEGGRTGWIVLAFTLIGTGFITKMMQAFVIVPVFGFVYLFAGPPRLGRRIAQLAAGALALLLSAGWWVAIVELVPASGRPYVGGSQNNSVFDLIFGYNGVGRLTGNEAGSVGGVPGHGRWGQTGWHRMFLPSWGGQISWFIPAALILLVAGLVITARAPRTDHTRVGFLTWGGWLLVTGFVFSYGDGIIHPYYSVALGPAIAALVGIGAVTLWRHRAALTSRVALATAVAATSVWTERLLLRDPLFRPELRPFVLVVGLLAALGIAFPPRLGKPAAVAAAVLSLAAVLTGPAAFSLATAQRPHDGALPSAGPKPAHRTAIATTPSVGSPVARALGTRPSGSLSGGSSGSNLVSSAPAPTRAPGSNVGFLTATRPNAKFVRTLQHDASHYTWVAATPRSNAAAGYQLATGDPVMAIGGFNGTDPAPTLHQFQQFVAEGRIHYYIGGIVHRRLRDGPPAPARPRVGASPSDTASQIGRWVALEFTRHVIGGRAIYDLRSLTLV